MQLTVRSPSIQEAFERFQKRNEVKNLSPETIKYYECYSRQLFAFLGDTTKPVSSIDQETIQNYILHLKAKETVSDVTVNTALRMASGFLYYCMEEGYVEAFKIHLIKADQPIKESYTDGELTRLLKKPDVTQCSFTRYRNWVIVSFLLATGCRASTLIHIRIGDIDLEKATVFFRHTKARNQQIVPLSKTIAGTLKEYLVYRGGGTWSSVCGPHHVSHSISCPQHST